MEKSIVPDFSFTVDISILDSPISTGTEDG